MIGVNYSQAGQTIRDGLIRAGQGIEQALERLATGKRINRASDDPSGLIAAKGFERDLVDYRKQIESLERKSFFYAAREGGLSAVNEILFDLKGVVTRAANKGALGEGEAQALQEEAIGLLKAIDFVSATQEFNGFQLLRGESSQALGLRDDGFDLVAGDVDAIAENVEGALDAISQRRAEIGHGVRAIESRVSVLQEQEINTADVLSLIQDADFAKEVSDLVRHQVLQAANTQLVQAERQQREIALELLRAVTPTR